MIKVFDVTFIKHCVFIFRLKDVRSYRKR